MSLATKPAPHGLDVISKKDHLYEVIETISSLYGLTSREEDILMTISLYGLSNKQIAAKYYLSERTVKNHVSHILKKTDSYSTRDLLSLVIHHSLQQTPTPMKKSV